MNVDLSAKQLFVIKLALAQLEPVDAATLNQTRQLIDSSINLYPGEVVTCEGCQFLCLSDAKLQHYCKHFHAPGKNTIDSIYKSPDWCPMLTKGDKNG